MLSIALAYSMITHPVRFPVEPIQIEVCRGEEVYRAGKGIERTLMEDRQAIGYWFDGRVRKDVEEAIWVSPTMVSRWLGYLQAKERWPKLELLNRWAALRDQLDGSLTFVVRLTA